MKFKDCFPSNINNFKIDRFSPEALAELPYATELELKNAALAGLLADGNIKIAPSPVVASPLERKYRTTTKRRVYFDRKQVFLHFGRKTSGKKVELSILEPDEHIKIYNYLQKTFSTPRNFKASSVLNYIIIRGSYTEHAVIFNVRSLSGDIVRILKAVCADTVKNIPSVKSIFLYVDDSNSDYYLEAERPAKGISFKKMHGSDFLAIKLNDKKFLYSPVSFSQINESILPLFFEEMKKHLTPSDDDILLDLYCGYGLWSLTFGDMFRNVLGMELAKESVQAAKNNAKFHYPDKNFRYETGFITADALRSKIPPPRGKKEWILLDPPRKGCEAQVHEFVLSRKPRKIFEMFCGADEIVPALHTYLNNNCKIEALIPFDFFPGTLNIEMLAIISNL